MMLQKDEKILIHMVKIHWKENKTDIFNYFKNHIK